MFELFEEVLMEVAVENGCTAWWEVFDSELMEEVEDRQNESRLFGFFVITV